MSCEDLPTTQELENNKLRIIHFGELIDNTPSGTSINPITGVTLKTYAQEMRDVGFKPASFTFVTGGTLAIGDVDKAIYNPAPAGDNNWYSWSGDLPHDVAAGTNPTAVGSGYVPRTDVVLRGELSEIDGANLVGGATYAQIRAYTGSATKIYCVGRQHVFDGAYGSFHVDSTDTTSADNDATILVDASGRRWKRQYSGYVKAAWCGVVADGVTDDTARAQFAINTFKSVEWHGVCAVSSVEFSRAGGEYKGAKFKALSNSATDCCVAITRGFLTFDILEIDGSLKPNYVSALKWHSPYYSTDGLASQRINIGKLSLANCKIGVLFGNVTLPVDAPQSENFINAFTSRGVEKVLYSNQPNGYLFVSNAVIDCGKYEWVSGFSEANSTCIEVFDGEITVTSSEVLKTATDLGYAIVVDGGNLMLSNTAVESPAKVYYVASTTKESNLTVNGSFGYFGTAANDYITISPLARGKVTLRDLRIYRPASANQAFTGLINHNSNTDVEFVIDNVTADEFLPDVVFKGDPLKCVNSMPLNCSVSNFKCKTSGAQADIEIQSNAKQYNALEKSVDSTCNSLYGWKRYVGYSGGDLTLVTDTPALSGLAQTNSLKLVSTGESSASSLDTTSASTVHATGLRCSGGAQFLLAGWCKVVVGGAQHRIGLRTVSSDLSTATVTVAIGTLDMPQNSEWVYFEKVVAAPSGAVYAGINISAEVGELRFSNLHMSKL